MLRPFLYSCTALFCLTACSEQVTPASTQAATPAAPSTQTEDVVTEVFTDDAIELESVEAVFRAYARAHQEQDMQALIALHDFPRMAELQLTSSMPAEAITSYALNDTAYQLERGLGELIQMNGFSNPANVQARLIETQNHPTLVTLHRADWQWADGSARQTLIIAPTPEGYRIVGYE